MSDKKTWGHNELAHDLAQSLRVNPEHIVWEDMQMGPSGSIRPDVYLLKKRYSTFAPVTYEVKISVSDFRSDITSGKWQGYLNFSSAVIFAVPAGLIKKEDVPAGCGLIVRHEEVWRMVKKPTVQHLETLPRESWMKLVIDGIDRATEQRDEARLRVSPNRWSVERALSKKLGAEVAEIVASLIQSRAFVADEIERNEKTVREIRDGTHQQLQWAKDALERDRKGIAGDLVVLAMALGLPAEATAHELSSAVHEASRRLTEDAEVRRLRGLIERIQKAASDGMLPLPGEQMSLLRSVRHA